jgi:hypothetical protein
MRRDELLDPDLLSELVLMSCGVMLIVALGIVLMAVVVSAAPAS